MEPQNIKNRPLET